MTLFTFMKSCQIFSSALRPGISNISRAYAACIDDKMCKKGYLQSPIDICRDVTEVAELPPVCYANHFESNVKLCMSQQMNTISIVPKMECPPTVQGGPLSCPFYLDQILFRWGATDNKGSEHSLDSTKFAMEAHLIYYNSIFNCFQEALNQPNGVAIIGVLLKTSNETTNLAMDDLIKCLCLLNCPGANVVLTKNVLKMFQCTLDSQEYYSYEGSLTYPPCSEEVLWLVFKKPVNINCYQVLPFRDVCDQNGNKICSNCRDLQQLNGRSIYDVKPCEIPDEISKKNVTKSPKDAAKDLKASSGKIKCGKKPC